MDAVEFAGARAADDQRNTGVFRADLLGKAPAIEGRQHQVKDHQIGPLTLKQPESLRTVAGPQHSVPGASQLVHDGLEDRIVVFDDEHRLGNRHTQELSRALRGWDGRRPRGRIVDRDGGPS